MQNNQEKTIGQRLAEALDKARLDKNNPNHGFVNAMIQEEKADFLKGCEADRKAMYGY